MRSTRMAHLWKCATVGGCWPPRVPPRVGSCAARTTPRHRRAGLPDRLTADRTVILTYHDSAGADVTGSKSAAWTRRGRPGVQLLRRRCASSSDRMPCNPNSDLVEWRRGSDPSAMCRWLTKEQIASLALGQYSGAHTQGTPGTCREGRLVPRVNNGASALKHGPVVAFLRAETPNFPT